MKNVRVILLALVALLIGVVFGGYVFSDTQPRSFLALNMCKGTCLRPNELLGLVASVAIQKFPGFVPSIVIETDKTIVTDCRRVTES